MNRDQPPPPAHGPAPEDLLLRRYHEANALDGARPAPALREAVLAHARSVAAAQSTTRVGAPDVTPRPAANDHRWVWRALGSVAVLGLVGLLALQFDRGTPEEREAAFGPPASPSAAPAPAPEAAPPATETSRDAVEPAPTQEVAPAPSAKMQRQRAEPASKPRPTTASPPAPPPAPAAQPSPRAAPGGADSMRSAPASPLAREEAHADREAADAAAPAPAQAAPLGASRQQMEAGVARRSASPAGPELLNAATRGDAAAVRSLLAQGVDVNSTDADGRTALMLAARRGDAALIRSLLSAGADPRRTDRDGHNASDHAREAGKEAVLPLLRVDPDR